MRLISTVKGFEGIARVFHDAEWEEFVVQFTPDGEKAPKADASYHTDDRADALGTARVMACQAPEDA